MHLVDADCTAPGIGRGAEPDGSRGYFRATTPDDAVEVELTAKLDDCGCPVTQFATAFAALILVRTGLIVVGFPKVLAWLGEVGLADVFAP